MGRATDAATVLLLLLFTLLPGRTTDARSAPRSIPLGCTGRRIHIRDLPPAFNLGLLSSCSDYAPFLEDFCHYLSDHGLGRPTRPGSVSWHRTDPLALEVLFHRRLLSYPCLSRDPSLADAVFLPYYSSLAALPYLYGSLINSSSSHGLDLFEFLTRDSPEVWRRHDGHDHFLVMARPAWDFSQDPEMDPPLWGTSFLEIPEFRNLTALTLESRTWPWQEHAIPYPTSFHPPDLAALDRWVSRVRLSPRTSLMLFAGGGGSIGSSPNVRRSIRLECEANATDAIDESYERVCNFVDCSNGICEHEPVLYMKPMLKASFCLQPPGDTPTRRSTFDGILAGCIPVFFEDQSARSQYGWHLTDDEFDEFSVTIPKEEVVFKGLKITDVLRKIPREKVEKMKEKVIELIPRIMYRKHESSAGLAAVKDAFDIAIESTLLRIKSRLEGLKIPSSQ
ncbi:hypothetical protein MLD38_018407 [Melastoma candidum]|uniref:Uncharacterized protein n=1 Tax=Melastoma candidum TaxID=119954 RepID=A0ACB9QTN2_9MYRT|nr:hypothetical protein MLD38_018407 [Melastoma candidum]